MSANNHAVNQAAINEGALSLITATAVLAGVATTNFDATYVHNSAATVAGNAVLEGGMIQQHAVEKVLTGTASGVNGGLVTKPGAATFDGDASIFALGILPQPGGNFFADASATFTGNFISPMAATPQGNATFTVSEAGTNFLRFAEMLHTADNDLYFEAFMTADPMIQLSGQSYYIHTAGWKEPATAEIDFAASEPKIVVQEWRPFGGAEFDVEITYKDRIAAAFNGTATGNVQASTVFYVSSDLSPSPAVFTSVALKRALPTATFDSGDATFASVTARTKQLLSADMQPTVTFPDVIDDDMFIAQNGGYIDIFAPAQIQIEEPTVVRGVEADATADATIYALSYTWAVRQAETAMLADGIYFSAAAILGPDSDVILRPPEVKDFIHPEEQKEFIRPLI